jgi:hypothetical protein
VPDLNLSPPVQIAAETGLTLYFVVMRPTNQLWWNLTTHSYETFAAGNWPSYVVPLSEPIANSGAYFAALPPNLSTGVIALLSVYQQQGTSPASTDPLYSRPGQQRPLSLVVELDDDGGVKSLSPLWSDGNAHPLQIPDRQNSLTAAQRIVDALYSARLKLAAQQHATVTIDGQSVTFRDPAKLDDQILFWERKVALLSGRRRRVQTMRLDRW